MNKLCFGFWSVSLPMTWILTARNTREHEPRWCFILCNLYYCAFLFINYVLTLCTQTVSRTPSPELTPSLFNHVSGQVSYRGVGSGIDVEIIACWVCVGLWFARWLWCAPWSRPGLRCDLLVMVLRSSDCEGLGSFHNFRTHQTTNRSCLV